jgi:hypothetical protein
MLRAQEKKCFVHLLGNVRKNKICMLKKADTEWVLQIPAVGTLILQIVNKLFDTFRFLIKIAIEILPKLLIAG